MNDRIHAALDGEIPRSALTAEEQEQLAALEAVIESAAGPLRSVAVPDLTARVMERVAEQSSVPARAAERQTAWERLFAWLWRPRQVTLRLRPVYALGCASAAVLLLLAVPGLVPPSGPAAVDPGTRAVVDGSAPRLYVEFRLEAPGATHVELAGTFTEWNPRYELRETAPGVWSALVPLEPGVHDYAFVVDGERWVADPGAPQVDDGFGGSNSRLFLPSPTPGSA